MGSALTYWGLNLANWGRDLALRVLNFTHFAILWLTDFLIWPYSAHWVLNCTHWALHWVTEGLLWLSEVLIWPTGLLILLTGFWGLLRPQKVSFMFISKLSFTRSWIFGFCLTKFFKKIKIKFMSELNVLRAAYKEWISVDVWTKFVKISF